MTLLSHLTMLLPFVYTHNVVHKKIMINVEHLISWLCTVPQQRTFVVLVTPLQVLKNYWKQTFFFLKIPKVFNIGL